MTKLSLLAVDPDLEREIVAGKDFVQIKTGPFDVDLVFAPDGISSFAEAKERGLTEGIFRVANLRDIIASKTASGRRKDRSNACSIWRAAAGPTHYLETVCLTRSSPLVRPTS